MGLNSTFLILHDNFHILREDIYLSEKLLLTLNSQRNYLDESVMKYIETHHSSDTVLIKAGGNTAESLVGLHESYNNDVALLKELAGNLGYRVVKK